jgi:Domain of unknown function (DUF4328)
VEIQWSDPLPAHPRPYSLAGLANALTVTLTINAAACLADLIWAAVSLVTITVFVASAILFLTWIYRARVNAGSSDWHQRRAAAWAVWGWIVPLGCLWIPFQVMADIWRAALPAGQRSRRAVLPGWWWACWLLGDTSIGPTRRMALYHSVYLTLAPLGAISAAACAVLLVVIVRKVSASSAHADGSPPD